MKGFTLRLRNSRRAVVVTHYGSFVLTFAVYALILKLHNFNSPVSYVLFALVCVYGISGLMLVSVSWPYGIRSQHWKTMARIDERQQRVRTDALAYSYWLSSSLVTIAFLWMTAADFSWGENHLGTYIWRPVTTTQWWWVFWIGFMVNSMFPAAIIAWNEPDLPVDTAMEHETVPG